ncbi:MAG: DUF1611 domain-containing protein [Pseudomonadota bacterium]
MNNRIPNTIIYCEKALKTTNGKTAHGLLRRSNRYNIVAVVDSLCKGKDSGIILAGIKNDIPVFATIQDAYNYSFEKQKKASHMVIGLAPDGGRFAKENIQDIFEAIKLKLNIHSGLHDYISENKEMNKFALEHGVILYDIRKPKPINELHFFDGRINEVDSLKIAILGTDSAIGKRTSAWIIHDKLNQLGIKTEMIGTGQTSWMQGANHCIIIDSLVSDFMSGEIENVVWTAWKKAKPEIILIEGQGSLLNPAYPGGFEILAAGRPDIIILQEAPARIIYDGFPDYKKHELARQIEAIEIISGKRVVAITINHENIKTEDIPSVCQVIQNETQLPTFDVLENGAEAIAQEIEKYLIAHKRKNNEGLK